MTKQKDATLTLRGSNLIRELGKVIKEESVPSMFFGNLSFTAKRTKAQRKQVVLHQLTVARYQMALALKKVRSGLGW